MKTPLIVTACGLLLLGVAACDQRPEPQGETTGAAMPDTSQATPVPGPVETAAPDAGDTGVVPADGSPPPVQPTPPAVPAPAK
ncbi:hypothetical protein ASE17_05500 [Phenylobacterium sp. Root77]|jgi:hypothetical protein|uniref:hypothetical protein n=1 Tax=unclassified Phenylobacterium TaxID=2640670 RepID=UPI0006FDDEBF|nr:MULTISPECIES: hypothetical protein [unclassified Phenylobacterium]KQW66488.1 hypothetical protein ASC73_19125 [Phenylobacterium sp. Root1277]KQW88994.1 hypothetical protein ASC79_20030 [Phenylobacterium sp. Root1290]KRC42150.1 hypothetical protein ASE17_05500 [Phenylobacterium sp. Root77]